MRTSLLIFLAAVLVAGSSLAVMNSACKNSHHGWCAPMSDIGRFMLSLLLALPCARMTCSDRPGCRGPRHGRARERVP